MHLYRDEMKILLVVILLLVMVSISEAGYSYAGSINGFVRNPRGTVARIVLGYILTEASDNLVTEGGDQIAY